MLRKILKSISKIEKCSAKLSWITIISSNIIYHNKEIKKISSQKTFKILKHMLTRKNILIDQDFFLIFTRVLSQLHGNYFEGKFTVRFHSFTGAFQSFYSRAFWSIYERFFLDLHGHKCLQGQKKYGIIWVNLYNFKEHSIGIHFLFLWGWNYV